MRILICDDDALILELLQKYIREYFNRRRLKCPELVCFSDGESLLADTGDKDIVFLDIKMPGKNGIYAGNELKRQNRQVIIFVITSYSEYLDDAMRFHVFRYLSKPLDRRRLFRNLDDALSLYHSITFRIPAETKSGVHMLLTSQIIAVEARARKVIVHTVSCDLESVRNMQYWLSLLPKNCFFQTHRSFIVNFEYVDSFDRTLVHMAGNRLDAYLTGRKYYAFKDAYLLYLENMR